MQGTWVSTVLRLGVGGESKALGQQKPCPYPQSRTGAKRPNLAAEKHGSVEKRRQKWGAAGRAPQVP